MCNFIVNCRLKYLNRTRGELETKKKKKKIDRFVLDNCIIQTV